MAAVANNPEFAAKAGIDPSVGQDFVSADQGGKFDKSKSRAQRRGYKSPDAISADNRARVKKSKAKNG